MDHPSAVDPASDPSRSARSTSAGDIADLVDVVESSRRPVVRAQGSGDVRVRAARLAARSRLAAVHGPRGRHDGTGTQTAGRVGAIGRGRRRALERAPGVQPAGPLRRLLLPPSDLDAGAAAPSRPTGIARPAVLVETPTNHLACARTSTASTSKKKNVAGPPTAASCDLHNIWTNERNGRQSVGDYLATFRSSGCRRCT
jgi:hypothetical protein